MKELNVQRIFRQTFKFLIRLTYKFYNGDILLKNNQQY